MGSLEWENRQAAEFWMYFGLFRILVDAVAVVQSRGDEGVVEQMFQWLRRRGRLMFLR